MSVLILADHDNQTLGEGNARAVAAAGLLGGEIDILVAGENCEAVAKAAGQIAGVRKVLLAQSAQLGAGLAEAVAATVVPLMSGYDALVTPASAQGKNVAPRIAALLDVAPLSDVVAIPAADTFVRPIYAGNALETVKSADPKKVITVRVSAFQPAAQGGAAPVENVAAADGQGSRFVSQDKAVLARPELGGAKVVISGGRALGSEAEFKAVLEPLADRLGAAIGASRAAVDAGYAPNDYQVGQTGKIVAPDLYLAIGISGAIQHLAGMRESRVIAAINTDPDAPIFGLADVGLVGDYKTAIPEILKALG